MKIPFSRRSTEDELLILWETKCVPELVQIVEKRVNEQEQALLKGFMDQVENIVVKHVRMRHLPDNKKAVAVRPR